MVSVFLPWQNAPIYIYIWDYYRVLSRHKLVFLLFSWVQHNLGRWLSCCVVGLVVWSLRAVVWQTCVQFPIKVSTNVTSLLVEACRSRTNACMDIVEHCMDIVITITSLQKVNRSHLISVSSRHSMLLICPLRYIDVHPPPTHVFMTSSLHWICYD